MKICCLSDLHGHFPDVPACDVLLLGGDYCPAKKREQYWWFREHFAPYLEKIAARGIKIIGIAGNHDWLFELNPHLVPPMDWTYLQDSGCEWGGLKFWGTPWQPRFCDWAFNLDEPELAAKWKLIPDDTDVLLVHGPPRGLGDYSLHGQEETGSPSLRARLEIVQPKLVVTGHIHEARGVYRLGATTVVNASYLDMHYRASWGEMIVVEIDT